MMTYLYIHQLHFVKNHTLLDHGAIEHLAYVSIYINIHLFIVDI